MTKQKLAKITATAITGTALTLGALVTFNGTETIDLAKTTIIELGEKIGIYESNENKLIAKINELKIERDELTLQLSEFEGMEPEEINEKIENLENQIVEYESQLSNAEENAETLAGRILDLEAEVLKANNKTSELLTTIDENVVEDEPVTFVELSGIIEEDIELTYHKDEREVTIAEGLRINYNGGYYLLRNTTGSSIKYQNGEAGTIRTAISSPTEIKVGEQYGQGVSLIIVTLSNGQTYKISIGK